MRPSVSSDPSAASARSPTVALLAGAALAFAALLLVSGLPLADAYEAHESNNVGSSTFYLYSGTTHSIGQKFITPSPPYQHAYMDRIGVWMDTTSTAGTVCMRFAQTGGSVTSSCKAATAVPASAGYVEFVFSPPVSFNPASYAEFYMDWDQSCTTCMRAYYSNANPYRASDSQSAKLTKESGNALIWPTDDTIFWADIDHSPVMVTDAASGVGGTSATLNGRNFDDSGTIANIHYNYGTTTGYGLTSSTITCPQGTSGSCSRTVSGLAGNTIYHFQICGDNGYGSQCGTDQSFTTLNNAPYAPTAASPLSGSTGVSVDTGLTWSGGDPDPGDTVTYRVYLDAGTSASTLRCTTTSTSCPSSSLGYLNPGQQYAWRVTATDTHGATANGPSSGAWTFTTKSTTCVATSPVILFSSTNYDGGCFALSASDSNFPADTMSNGFNLNDQASSVQVKPGYWAILYGDANYGGTSAILSGNNANLAGISFDKAASSIRILKCDPNAKVVLFKDSVYNGPCIAYNVDDTDFTDNTWSDGTAVNDQPSSLWVKEGYVASLYLNTPSDPSGVGTPLVVVHDQPDLSRSYVNFNDVASGLKITGSGTTVMNNAFATPALVADDYVYTVRESTAGAGTEVGESTTCGTSITGGTVWFKFVARHSGTARISTWGSDYNTVLAAYSGTSLGSPQVTCNNDDSGTTQSHIEFTCVAGQEYRIQVGGLNGATGNLLFQASGCMSFHQDPFVPSPVLPHDPICAANLANPHFELLYVHANDAPDLYNQRAARLRALVGEMNSFLHYDASLQGGRTADYVVKCSGGQVDVQDVGVNVPSSGDVVGALQPSFSAPNTKYIIWFEKRYDCGYGFETGATGSNAFSSLNGYAGGNGWSVIFCDDSEHGAADMMHEVGHAMGAVNSNAPHSDGGSHCTDKRSMMCDNDADNPADPCSTLRYDCGYDDYFNPNPTPGTWIFNHWNQGHKYNAFIQFGTPPANDDFAARTGIGSAPYAQTVGTTTATHEMAATALGTEPWSATCGSQTNTVWYSYTPAVSGTVTVTTAGSSFSTTLAAYTGSSINSLAQVTCDSSGATTSQISFNAVGGTAYAIQVGGKNGAAGSLQVSLSCAPNNCVPSPPSAPQSPAAAAGPGVGQITVSWSAPASNGGSAITQYNVYGASSSSGPFSLLGTTGGSTFSYAESGLGNGVARFYRVSATNSLGEGPQSGTASATTWAVPGAPQNLAASAGPSPGQIRLTWAAPASNGGTAITGYTVYRGTSSTGPFSFVGTTSGSTLTYTDSGLGNGATRYYVVSASNAVGEGPQSGASGATTWTVPGAPQSPAATAGPSPGQIRLTWAAPASNGGTAVTGYTVYRGTSSSGPFSLLATTGAATLAYTDTGLGNGASRYYVVSASNVVGEGPQTSSVGATTWTVPSAPLSLDAQTGTSLNQINVVWSAPASTGGTAVTSYQLYRATAASGPFSFVATIPAPTLTYTDSGLTPATTYWYYATATNAVGPGPSSNTDCAKPYPNPLGGC
ncbi:MAG: trimeric autotransporter adhesin [Thermoplasmata archaeon]|jgi:fibronectin type 3 domain-containing protein|nr:trimeric autotransporter adhesin [Thermoplasmata archaeon]